MFPVQYKHLSIQTNTKRPEATEAGKQVSTQSIIMLLCVYTHTSVNSPVAMVIFSQQ